MGVITIVGLGPSEFGLVTAETLAAMQAAPRLMLRTVKHPAVAGLTERGIAFTSYDQFYERYPSFDALYDAIATDCVKRAGQEGDVVFAVPGSPMVAEKSVVLIREKAKHAGVKVKVLPAISFLDILYARLDIDPINGLTIIDAADIDKLPPQTATGVVITQVFNRQVASDAKLGLMDYFPDEYPVVFVRNLGLADEEIREIPLYELDRQPVIDHLTSVYVPPHQDKGERFTLDPLIDVMARLRAPGGCVWDIEQTHSSLRRYIVEEVYEVLEAIELADADKLCEELGDLLLQIVFHARIAEESGCFGMQDVVDTVTEKMVRRHPHVFGDITVRDAAEVIVNWDKIKSREKKGERSGVLDGVPVGLPSLMRAHKLQSKAAKVGFDWNSVSPVWDKIYEEIEEFKAAAAAGDKEKVEEELGDILFTLVNLSRFFDIEPETALTRTNNKFIRRFTYIEDYIKSHKLQWKNLTLEQLDALWEEAKSKKSKENQ